MRELAVILFAVSSTIALFVDVESTGNLSMALNGDGIPQLIALVILIYVYRRIWIQGELLHMRKRRERAGYAVIAFLFTLAMIIGKAQGAEEDLKYSLIAVILFAGYMPLFYVIISFLGGKITDMADGQGECRTSSRVTRWLFEDHVVLGVMLVVFLLPPAESTSVAPFLVLLTSFSTTASPASLSVTITLTFPTPSMVESSSSSDLSVRAA